MSLPVASALLSPTQEGLLFLLHHKAAEHTQKKLLTAFFRMHEITDAHK